jgi:hypothetical protein
MSATEAAEALKYLQDSLKGLLKATAQAERAMFEILAKEAGEVHPDFIDRTVFPVTDRAETVKRAAAQYQALLRQDGGQ